jgi:uncharacterized membrane protein YecN with MAPEG domain
VTPDNLTEFFAASAAVAGGLIGLLFVAISVAGERLADAANGQMNRIRAQASLTAFTNAIAVSLFALIPGEKLGWTAFVVAVAGIVFVFASLLSLIRLHRMHWNSWNDIVFLLGLVATFVVQLVEAILVIRDPHDDSSMRTIAVMVIVCFLIGIARAWELIGGPSIGLGAEIRERVRGSGPEDEPPR